MILTDSYTLIMNVLNDIMRSL